MLVARWTIQTSLTAKMVESYTSEAKIDEVSLNKVNIIAWQIDGNELTGARPEGEAMEEHNKSTVE